MQGRVGAYEVWGRLSAGGMGDVWLARHAELVLPVILKTLRPAAGETHDIRYRRLLDEARLTARVSSPRVVRVVDAGAHDIGGEEALPFLVEEYVDGIDLAELDRRRRSALRRPLPLWAVAELVGLAAEGVHAAHQVGVIHRDVKPQNLFGHGAGDLKVGDFGVAVSSGSAIDAAAGTPGFMAPEQLEGARVDRRADVYSLGATAFVLRYGSMAFETQQEALAAAAAPRFPPSRTPEEAFFQHVLARMMARRPEARYPNLAVVRQHLRALAAATRPPAAGRRLRAGTYDLCGVAVTVECGDLSRVETDAIVNSAGSSMRMDAGLGAALLRRGGTSIEDEALAGGERALGECVATSGGTLDCTHVLHAVGAWNEVSCVARATHRALLLAEELGHARVALPAIGTGRGRVSIEACADVMAAALRLHLALGGSRLREVRVVLVDEATRDRFDEIAGPALAGIDEPATDDQDAPFSAGEATSETLFASSKPTAR